MQILIRRRPHQSWTILPQWCPRVALQLLQHSPLFHQLSRRWRVQLRQPWSGQLLLTVQPLGHSNLQAKCEGQRQLRLLGPTDQHTPYSDPQQPELCRKTGLGSQSRSQRLWQLKPQRALCEQLFLGM